MKRSSPMLLWMAGLTLCLMVSAGMSSQPVADASGNPTAATTATSAPADTMSKRDIKHQRQQQKKDEAAARADAKASKATAKSKEANDKALQAQEKAGQVTQTPPASSTPTTTTTTAPPQ